MARFWEWLFNKIAAGEFERLYQIIGELRDEIDRLRKELDRSNEP